MARIPKYDDEQKAFDGWVKRHEEVDMDRFVANIGGFKLRLWQLLAELAENTYFLPLEIREALGLLDGSTYADAVDLIRQEAEEE